MMLRSAHGDVRVRPQPEDDLPKVRLGPAVSRDVDVAAPRGQPGERTLEGGVVTGLSGRDVVRPADSGFAQVIPSGPDEIADDVRIVDDASPTGVDGGGVRL